MSTTEPADMRYGIRPAVSDPRLQAAEALAGLLLKHDGADSDYSPDHPLYFNEATCWLGAILDTLAAGGDVIVTRPVCKTCGGMNRISASPDYEEEATSKPCPDCIDGKLPTEVIRVQRHHRVDAWAKVKPSPCPGCSTDGSNALGLRGHLPDCIYNPMRVEQ